MKELASPPIAQGRTAEIYLWDDQHVLKLLRDWCPSDWAEYEARIARAVYAAGIPSPAPGKIIEVNGRRGLIYERLEGMSMLEEINTRPWTLLKHARSLAELQVQINQQSITELPSCKDRLRRDICNTTRLKQDVRDRVLAVLDTLPDAQNLCHSDFHPGNILMTKRGPVVIDWMTACTGSMWADVARTHLLLSIGAKSAGKQINPVVKMAIGSYHKAYRRRHHQLVPDPERQAERWLPIIAAARLHEDIVPEREALIRMVQQCA